MSITLAISAALALAGPAQATDDAGLTVGSEAPEFRLPQHDQLKLRLSSLRGEKNVVLVFYPLAFTPV